MQVDQVDQVKNTHTGILNWGLAALFMGPPKWVWGRHGMETVCPKDRMKVPTQPPTKNEKEEGRWMGEKAAFSSQPSMFPPPLLHQHHHHPLK